MHFTALDYRNVGVVYISQDKMEHRAFFDMGMNVLLLERE
jgi:hypothetical protein